MNAKISLCVVLLLYAYSENTGKYLSVHGEYSEFRVVCGTQNRLRVRGKNLCVHGEDAKIHKTVYISVNNNMNFKFFKIPSIYTM